MTANTLCNGYFLRQVDGNNYETLTAAQARPADFILTMTAATSGYFTSSDIQTLPTGNFKVALTNNSNVAFSASGSVLTITPKTRQWN